MNQHKGIIGIFPVFSCIILAVGLMNHVMVIPALLLTAKRDAWISTIGVIVPYLLWVWLLYYIMKKTNQKPLIPWLQQHYGIIVSMGFRVFFIVYAAFISGLTLQETVVWTHMSYLPRTPTIVLSLALVVLCLTAVHYGFKSIAIASGILLPFVVLFGDFVMSSNLPKKEYGLLFPVFEDGMMPALKGGIYMGGGLVELVFILLIQHHLKSQVRLWSMWTLALFLIVLVAGPLTGAIAEFGPFEAAKLRFPAYEEWRLVQIGKYISHVDFLSIYQWLSGAVIRIALMLYTITELVAIKKKGMKIGWIIISGLLLVIIVEIPFSGMQYLTFMREVYFPTSLISVLCVSIVLFFLVLLVPKRGRVR